MQILSQLKTQLCQTIEIPKLTQGQFNEAKKMYKVVLMAGGESSRFKEVQGSSNVNKSAFTLPNGDTMIEMTIRMYAKSGLKNFLVLVYHNASSIIDLLGSGDKYGVNIDYCFDPERPVGKGGAIRNAYEKGHLQLNEKFIVHNPDDVIINYPDDFPLDIISAHEFAETRDCEATVVTVLETPHQYSGMKIENGFVTEIDMYPMLPIPTHIGVTLFSNKIFERFNIFSYDKPMDFEKILFPILSKENKLFATSIPTGTWIAVNNLKSYKELIKTLESKST